MKFTELIRKNKALKVGILATALTLGAANFGHAITPGAGGTEGTTGGISIGSDIGTGTSGGTEGTTGGVNVGGSGQNEIGGESGYSGSGSSETQVGTSSTIWARVGGIGRHIKPLDGFREVEALIAEHGRDIKFYETAFRRTNGPNHMFVIGVDGEFSQIGDPWSYARDRLWEIARDEARRAWVAERLTHAELSNATRVGESINLTGNDLELFLRPVASEYSIADLESQQAARNAQSISRADKNFLGTMMHHVQQTTQNANNAEEALARARAARAQLEQQAVMARMIANQTPPARQETPRQETPRQETPRQETPRQETPRQETPRQETPRQETPRQETPRQEKTGKLTALRQDVNKNTQDIANLDTRVTTVEETVQDHGNRLTTVEETVQDHGNRLTTLTITVENQGDRLTTIEDRLAILEEEAQRPDRNLDLLWAALAGFGAGAIVMGTGIAIGYNIGKRGQQVGTEKGGLKDGVGIGPDGGTSGGVAVAADNAGIKKAVINQERLLLPQLPDYELAYNWQ